MGLNTIETYVAWNAHEPVRGEWDAAGAERPRTLPRPHRRRGPACDRPPRALHLRRVAQRRAAGVAHPDAGDRDPSLRAAVRRRGVEYLRRVYEIVAPRQIDRGGNVVLVQIENEYGAYGSDKDYLAELVARDAGRRHHRAADDRRPAAAADARATAACPSCTAPARSARAPRSAWRRCASTSPTGPLMCSEFWDGWFDWWGGCTTRPMPRMRPPSSTTLLAAGASVNIYMFHGGTNFGLTNGANDKGRYVPIVTSYDYDAPLDEAGNPTAKFLAFREVIARYAPVPGERPPERATAPALSVPSGAGEWTECRGPTSVVTEPTPRRPSTSSGTSAHSCATTSTLPRGAAGSSSSARCATSRG